MKSSSDFSPKGRTIPLDGLLSSRTSTRRIGSSFNNLRPLIAAAHIRYHIDLWNEGSPGARQPVVLEYCQRLWNQYAAAHGTRDSVGFSIIPGADRLQLLSAVYGNSPFGNHGPPRVLDLHFYKDAAARFASAHAILRAAGYRQPWILGESYYNDSG